MKKGLTELVFILDRSGSMCGLESDTIGGFNSVIEKQKGIEGEAVVTTVLFDDKYEILHDRININGIKKMTEDQYYVRGCTALLDAIGKTINKIGNVQKNTAGDMRAEKVIITIITDGMENASREYSYSKIKNMITRQQEKYGWEFMFLGANIDAVAEAGKMGISEDRAVTYENDSEGVEINYDSIGRVMSFMRVNDERMDSKWKEKIEQHRKDKK